MRTLLVIMKTIWPYLKEFGIVELVIKHVKSSKALTYSMCLLLVNFYLFFYMLDQAYQRMHLQDKCHAQIVELQKAPDRLVIPNELLVTGTPTTVENNTEPPVENNGKFIDEIYESNQSKNEGSLDVQ